MSRKKGVTMSAVAAQAGVSIKTVSNVVNDWPYVTDETRQRVLRAIESVGYRPNQMARSLVTGKTKAIGVVVPDISNPFFGAAIRGCEDVLFGPGYSMFLCNTNEDVDRERYYLDQLLSRGVDALILWGTRLCCRDLEALVGTEAALVTVELGEEPTGPNHICINVDNLRGARLATEHLIASGHRRIAHLAGPPGRVTTGLRRQGYEQALQSAGLPAPARWVVQPEQPSIRGGFHAALPLLQAEKPEAIFCFNDLLAFGAVLAARHLGLAVPDDLALVGFDDIDMASMIDPPLTTVRIPQYRLGKLVGEVVLDRLHRGESARKLILYPVELQIRGSSGKGLFTDGQRRATLEGLISSLFDDAAESPPGDSPDGGWPER